MQCGDGQPVAFVEMQLTPELRGLGPRATGVVTVGLGDVPHGDEVGGSRAQVRGQWPQGKTLSTDAISAVTCPPNVATLPAMTTVIIVHMIAYSTEVAPLSS